MTWIVARRCRDCMDIACVSVCPVDSTKTVFATEDCKAGSQSCIEGREARFQGR